MRLWWLRMGVLQLGVKLGLRDGRGSWLPMVVPMRIADMLVRIWSRALVAMTMTVTMAVRRLLGTWLWCRRCLSIPITMSMSMTLSRSRSLCCGCLGGALLSVRSFCDENRFINTLSQPYTGSSAGSRGIGSVQKNSASKALFADGLCAGSSASSFSRSSYACRSTLGSSAFAETFFCRLFRCVFENDAWCFSYSGMVISDAQFLELGDPHVRKMVSS
eukprot:13405_5